MWVAYDRTLAEWLDNGDVIRYDGIILTVTSVDGDDELQIDGIDEWDDETSVLIGYDTFVDLVMWEDDE